MSNITIDLGKVAITLGGDWHNDRSYEALTEVVYGPDGRGYVSLRDNINVIPGTDPNTWMPCVNPGKSLYELALNHGYVGTEEQFVQQYNDAVKAAQTAASVADTKMQQFKAAEADRGSAEASRVASENARELAESARNQAEINRASAESSRAAAETARAKAETARVQSSAEAVAAANAATGLADAATLGANTAAAGANTAAQAAQAAATTCGQLNAGLIGLAADDGELVLIQNAETGTVESAAINDDGEAEIVFAV